MVIYTELEYLTPDTEDAAKEFLQILAAKGLAPKVLETYREQSRQDELYAQYLRGDNHKTNTNRSWHTAGRALDIQINRADIASILFFLDTARALGFSTVADPDKVRAAVASGNAPDLWDWHHVSFHNGRTKAQAIAQYDELLERGPAASAGLFDVLGKLLFVSSVVSLFYHGTKNS